ncbi:MAG: UDP-N-acetylmuramate dehydrogenase [Gemmatimonadota bacterium]
MRDVPLAPRTRWRIGGPAPAFATVHSEDELRHALDELDGDRVLVLGLGANLLVSDEGPGAPVISLDGDFREFEILQRTIRFGAAVPIAGVVQAARRNDRSGLWILEAVPGMMGGALRMNAGTAEEGIWERVMWADVMYPDGRTRRVTKDDVRPSYRAIDLEPSAIFLRAEVSAPPATPEDSDQIQEEHLRRRDEKLEAQVYDLPTCGSTWRNPAPPAPSAWELVAQVGMRGTRVGGAQVSPKHANFIVNLGDARAQDVVDLMIETRSRVLAETGISLEPEIHFWGFSDDVLSELGVKS